MKRDRAAYMRDYRARRRRTTDHTLVAPSEAYTALQQENERLTAEVARLKRLLATRSESVGRDPYREFRPVPKPGHK